mgnify:CR=1 FL=1
MKFLRDLVDGFWSVDPYLLAMRSSNWTAIGRFLASYGLIISGVAIASGLWGLYAKPSVLTQIRSVPLFEISPSGEILHSLSDETTIQLLPVGMTLVLSRSELDQNGLHPVLIRMYGSPTPLRFGEDVQLTQSSISGQSLAASLESFYPVLLALWAGLAMIGVLITRSVFFVGLALFSQLLDSFSPRSMRSGSQWIRLLLRSSITAEIITLCAVVLYNGRPQARIFELSLLFISGYVLIVRWLSRPRAENRRPRNE